MAWRILMAAVMMATAGAGPAPLQRGADVSMLLEMERFGAVYRDAHGVADAITILRRNGFQAFRLRLFLSPNLDYDATHGATQDLAAVRELGRRIAAADGQLLLALHYSDSWADPKKQHKPAAWVNLDPQALEQAVEAYTRDTLADLARHGVRPAMVQIGNEITNGMLWPDGQLTPGSEVEQRQQWDRLAGLLRAGIRGVRAFERQGGSPIEIVLHIDGGGIEGRARWFFSRLAEHELDYDVAALSFYPAWGDDMALLRQALTDVVELTGRPVFLAETSYPHRAVELPTAPAPILAWPKTVQGQAEFVRDLEAVLRAVPGGKARGWFWWYPEAQQVGGRFVWRGGAEGLFDASGLALPAMRAEGGPGVAQP